MDLSALSLLRQPGEHHEMVLLAPSLRIGRQWLDALARSPQSVLNIRLKTIRHLALDLATPEMERKKLTFLRGLRAELFVARIFDAWKGRLQYFGTTPMSYGLIRVLCGTLGDLRMAGMRPGRLRADAFEDPRKAADIDALLRGYEDALSGSGATDYAGVLALAVGRITSDVDALSGALLAAPADLVARFAGLERRLWEAVPTARRREFGELPSGDALSDLRRAWEFPPSEKQDVGDRVVGECEAAGNPDPDRDVAPTTGAASGAPTTGAASGAPTEQRGRVRITRAVGEVNEVRAVIRECVAGGIPFDQVEIIHTDRSTYVPLIYEEISRITPEGQMPPVTFAEGIPAHFSRPGRALLGWLEWMSCDHAQMILARMLQDGLISVPATKGEAAGNPDPDRDVAPTGVEAAGNACVAPTRVEAADNACVAPTRVEGEGNEGAQPCASTTGAASGTPTGGAETKRGQDETSGPLTGARLASILRATRIGAGDRRRYMESFERAIIKAREEQKKPAGSADPDVEYSVDARRARRPERIAGLETLSSLAGSLFDCSEGPAEPGRILANAACFLKRHARRASEADGYGAEALLEAIGEFEECLKEMRDAPPLDVMAWLRELPGRLPLGGRGPMPGCLYVSGLPDGGHSGRSATFIIGLDDARFPGAGAQNPVVLDDEREKLGNEMPTAAGSVMRRVQDFYRLIAGIRGEVTLSYSLRSLEDDREMFASGPLFAVWRVISGQADGDYDRMLSWFGEPAASFAPLHERQCLGMSDWWLWRALAEGEGLDWKDAILDRYPHLARGHEAQAKRLSAEFTEYDGFVPQAGADCEAKCLERAFSPSALETVGKCPMEYFFRYVLGIEPPEEYKIERDEWLDAAQRGTLLHDVFREFITELCRTGETPSLKRDWPRLEEILAAAIERETRENPPFSAEVLDRERQELRRSARIFLRSEEANAEKYHPRYCELWIGSGGQAPVRVSLPGGRRVLISGRIDRVDEVAGSNGKEFWVWDYKTGSASKYSRRKPFREGRIIQHAIYLRLADNWLKNNVSGEARAAGFGYFFPTTRAFGERILWERDELSGGRDVLKALVDLVATGCFCFTTDARDVKFSDYLIAYGDAACLSEAVKKKIANAANSALEPFRELRRETIGEGFEKEEEE